MDAGWMLAPCSQEALPMPLMSTEVTPLLRVSGSSSARQSLTPLALTCNSHVQHVGFSLLPPPKNP